MHKVIHLVMTVSTLVLLSLSAEAQQPQIPDTMPAWTLATQDGELVSSERFAGKPLVIHFWSTWCPHCKHLQPGLDRLAREYQDQGLQFISISFNEQDGAQPQTELENRGLSLRTLVKGEALAIKEFAVFGTPTTVFVAPDGRILGATMQSDPNDPQWRRVADYLVSLTP